MALSKQIHIYNLDTSCFYSDKEQLIHRRLNRLQSFKVTMTRRLRKKDISEDEMRKANKCITNVDNKIKDIKKDLRQEFKHNKFIRQLNPKAINIRNIISIFESALTRTIGIPTNTLSFDLMVVRTYYFDILEDIILNGYLYNGERYVFLTSSAGQIRTKKSVFVKESILKKHQKALMCGLTTEVINNQGGININKYLAYLALNNSATDEWNNFKIDSAIVVDDMETMVNGVVDFISDKTYDVNKKKMDVPIEHTDGCGMILPSLQSKNIMVRLPWIKGLLSPFAFDAFLSEKKNSNSKIKDIYGKEWDIIEDNIKIIFTKSQFKMWRHYPNILDENGSVVTYGWDRYKEYFKKYNCQASTCNEEPNTFKSSRLGYQMLQTLTDMTNDELEQLCHRTVKRIVDIGSDRGNMLRVLGVTQANTNKNYLQQAIEIYPELLSDTYCKEILKQVKKSLVRDARAGKININGKYTYIIPDLYAFCEYLFLKDKCPKGLLEDGEVYCKLYKNVKNLDCLRSPHLYREHAVKKNVIDETKQKWFITNGIYTSCHDLISKMLQFDCDGDQSLVVADRLFTEVAKRNMEGVVPLYYNMANAPDELINNRNIYNGMIAAYTGGNIGEVSNNISKCWNSKEVSLEVVKLLCMENNFIIDHAKTLYKPTRPQSKNSQISKYTKGKLPHFFIYAKNKNKKQVAKRNNSVVNRLESIIPNPNIKFKKIGLGKFDYRLLMNDKNVDINTELAKKIIEKYTKLDLGKYFLINRSDDEKEKGRVGNLLYLYQEIRKEILSLGDDKQYLVDVLIKYLYNYKKSSFKTTLWECFGDVIVDNLRLNINTALIYCTQCGDLTEPTNNRQQYCSACAKEVWNEYNKKKQREYYNKKKDSV